MSPAAQYAEQQRKAVEILYVWEIIPADIIPRPIPRSIAINKVEFAAPRRFEGTILLTMAWKVGHTTPFPKPSISAAE